MSDGAKLNSADIIVARTDELQENESDCEEIAPDSEPSSPETAGRMNWGRPGFRCARSLLINKGSEAPVNVSPGFRNVAAKAGWDDEALLLVALEEGAGPQSPESRICKERCGHCQVCRERKREVRTPGQAVTPLSANRKQSKARRQSNLVEIPLTLLNLNHESDSNDQSRHKSLSSTCQKTTLDCQSQDNKLQQQLEEVVYEHAPTPDAQDTKQSLEAASPSKSLHLDQLREELSCAVCLDICFEPSTTCCGHSFCRKCLKSVLQKCGPRCPKCRQTLRGDAVNACSINTVLWNTVQILFPSETSKRIKEKNEADAKETEVKKREAARSNLSDRAAAISRWRNLNRNRSIGIGSSRRSTASASASASSYGDEEEIRGVGRRERLFRGQSTQEESDAALANILQQTELMVAGSEGVGMELEKELERYQRSRHQRQSLSTAVANLRSVASRTIRHSARNQFSTM